MRRVPHVLVLLEHAMTGGGTLVAADLIRGWSRKGLRPRILILGHTNDEMREALGRNGDVEILGLDGHGRRIRELRRHLRRLGPGAAVLAIGDYCGLMAATATLGLSRRHRPLIVIGEHQPRPLRDAVTESRGPLVASLFAAVEVPLRRRTAGSVFTAAGQDRASVAWRRSGRPGTIIPNPSRVASIGAGAVSARLERLRRRGDVRLIVVGALNAQKDHATLLSAMRMLDDRFTLTVIGRGEVDVAGLAGADPLLADRVTVLGARDDVIEQLDRHDVLMLSSRRETAYPLVVIEAVARGLPVVATECSPVMGAFAEALDSVTIVPVGDAPALAAAVSTTADDPPSADVLMAAATELRDRHDPDRAADAHLEFLAEVSGH